MEPAYRDEEAERMKRATAEAIAESRRIVESIKESTAVHRREMEKFRQTLRDYRTTINE